MARRRGRVNPLALAVLAMLRDRPMHPYQIARLLRHRGKDQSIKIRYGSLYTVMRNLERRGLVAAEGTARSGRRPERTVYRLTDDGRDELHERLSELVSEPVKEYPLFEAALSLLMALSPDEASTLLGERLRSLRLEIAAARAMLEEVRTGQHLPRLFLLESEYALAMKTAEAEWVRGMIDELAGGSLDGLDLWRAWHKTGEFPPELMRYDWARADQALLEEREEGEDRTADDP